jgi:hypothetical protein
MSLGRRKTLIRRVTRILLATGFTAAVVAYVVARQKPEKPLGYDPLQTKTYRHDLELYGGKANVLAAEFREWFAGLWYGTNLAYTIAVLTVLLVLVVRFALTPAYPMEVEPEEAEPPPPN